METNDEQTALLRGREKGHIAIMRMLLEYKGDVNIKTKDGQTVLPGAAENKANAVLQLLKKREREPELSLELNEEETAMLCAAGYGNDMKLQLLLERGVDVNTKTEEGATGLCFAASNGHKDAV